MAIKLCPQTECNKYPEGMAQLLVILGYPEALVTDRSTIQDFDVPDGVKLALELLCETEIYEHDELWVLAQMLQEQLDKQ